MNTLLNAIQAGQNVTTTANGAKAYKSTESRTLDLFGSIAACRNNVDRAVKLFNLAYAEDPETATRILFWCRDIRGGQGERSVFRAILKEFVRTDLSVARKILSLVPEYGRWDDLLIFEDSVLWNEVLEMISTQIREDTERFSNGLSISLLGKWLPSINASSKDSKRIGRKIAAHLGLNERGYRKLLKNLRTQIRIVEQAMCAREWDSIEYSKLPSRAGFMYRKAFANHDGVRYQSYLDAVKKGDAKINAGTLYPYDIVEKCLYQGESNDTLEVLWNALPNYMEGKEFNGLVVADVSGSMRGRPMAVSISLAMYIAERNSSPVWKDKFLTFSGSPKLQTITGVRLSTRIRNLERAEWGGNTDLQKTFDLILDTAVQNNVPESDMPRKLIIVSDMQFDACATMGGSGSGWSYRGKPVTNFEAIRVKYAQAGYSLPEVIFWNVNAHDNVPMKVHDSGTALVSGCSPSILTAVLTGNAITPVSLMRDAVYAERYAPVGEIFGDS